MKNVPHLVEQHFPQETLWLTFDWRLPILGGWSMWHGDVHCDYPVIWLPLSSGVILLNYSACNLSLEIKTERHYKGESADSREIWTKSELEWPQNAMAMLSEGNHRKVDVDHCLCSRFWTYNLNFSKVNVRRYAGFLLTHVMRLRKPNYVVYSPKESFKPNWSAAMA